GRIRGVTNFDCPGADGDDLANLPRRICVYYVVGLPLRVERTISFGDFRHFDALNFLIRFDSEGPRSIPSRYVLRALDKGFLHPRRHLRDALGSPHRNPASACDLLEFGHSAAEDNRHAVKGVAANSISTRELTSGALFRVGPLALPVAAMPQGLHLGRSQPALRFV